MILLCKKACGSVAWRGTIARLVLERSRDRALPGIQFVALSGRSPASRGAALGREFKLPYVVGRTGLLEHKPDAILEGLA